MGLLSIARLEEGAAYVVWQETEVVVLLSISYLEEGQAAARSEDAEARGREHCAARQVQHAQVPEGQHLAGAAADGRVRERCVG